MRASKLTNDVARAARHAGMVAAAIVWLAGCAPWMPSMPKGTALPQPKERTFELSYWRAAGTVERYEWFLARKSNGPGTHISRERTRSLIMEYCLGKTSQDLDKVYFRRREYAREFMQTFVRKGEGDRDEVVTIIDETPRDGPVILTDNRGRDSDKPWVTFYYTIARDGQFGMLPERKYHLLVGDSAAFLFPILPKKPVKVGDSWERATAIRVGMSNRPYQFEVKMTAKLSEIVKLQKEGKERLCAKVEYEYRGQFNSEDHPELSAAEILPVRTRHEVKGSGWGRWGLKEGRFLWKDDVLEVRIIRRLPKVTRTQEEGKQETHTSFQDDVEEHHVHVRARYLDYQERMRPSRSRRKGSWAGVSHRGRKRARTENP